MQSPNQTLFIIEDDADVRDALRWLFESVQYRVETYQSASQFLERKEPHVPGCLIVDVRLPGMSGLELLEQLKLEKCRLPVIIITGHGDIQMAVRAMKAGAVDFILKPFNDQCLLEVVQKCMCQVKNCQSVEEIDDRIKTLSEREQQILELIMEGKLNKEIAYDLSISISTVEAHRSSIMHKMHAKNLAQLIKTYLQAQHNLEF